jgi:hypothetical protein
MLELLQQTQEMVDYDKTIAKLLANDCWQFIFYHLKGTKQDKGKK